MTLKDEILAKCSAQLIAAQEHGQIAAIVNVGRTKTSTKMLSERGVRAALGPVNGSLFINMLKSLETAASTSTVPAWLTAVLTGLGVPSDQHVYYLSTLGCGYSWLRTDVGLDVGDATTQSMLDLIAAGNPTLVTACTTLKALAVVSDPVTVQQVIAALKA